MEDTIPAARLRGITIMLLALPVITIRTSQARLRTIRTRDLYHKVLDIVDAIREAELVGWVGAVEFQGSGLADGPIPVSISTTLDFFCRKIG